jgi:hypothetical protein
MRLRRFQENFIAVESSIRNVECLLLASSNWRCLRTFIDVIVTYFDAFSILILSWHVFSCYSSNLFTRNGLAVTPLKCCLLSNGGPGLVVAYSFRIYCLNRNRI